MAEWSSHQLSLANERQEDCSAMQCGRTFDLPKRKQLGLIISQSSFPTLLYGSIEFPASHQIHYPQRSPLSTLFKSWLISAKLADHPRQVWQVDEWDVKLRPLSFHHSRQAPLCAGLMPTCCDIFCLFVFNLYSENLLNIWVYFNFCLAKSWPQLT